MALSTMAHAPWTILSSRAAIASGLCRPSAFGMYVRRDGCGRYWTTACETCALKAQCTPGKERRISRWEHEAVLETVQDRLDRNPGQMRRRRPDRRHPCRT